ncbi:hypothetical protein [Arthrobacter crystallopoietes]|uniref:Uncharacterized protein n=1 Tax=Crystallibacter crystallopoietes TaxID=37928 RepID=A0A1H1G127_9MICC|nr:hypothetical protein [Arthrobacter crystallopoietes]AUI52821.1 hypothetical protein AC20117_20505 [Arthrobacter crystallopoietes]SDR06937.1 hypothetical protein SAMN04489742_3776 [Arthrobacter crystallopoietes]
MKFDPSVSDKITAGQLTARKLGHSVTAVENGTVIMGELRELRFSDLRAQGKFAGTFSVDLMIGNFRVSVTSGDEVWVTKEPVNA